MEFFKLMEEQQVVLAREFVCIQSEVTKLRSEVERLWAVSTSPNVTDNDRGLEKIDSKLLVEDG